MDIRHFEYKLTTFLQFGRRMFLRTLVDSDWSLLAGALRSILFDSFIFAVISRSGPALNCRRIHKWKVSIRIDQLRDDSCHFHTFSVLRAPERRCRGQRIPTSLNNAYSHLLHHLAAKRQTILKTHIKSTFGNDQRSFLIFVSTRWYSAFWE